MKFGKFDCHYSECDFNSVVIKGIMADSFGPVIDCSLSGVILYKSRKKFLNTTQDLKIYYN